MSLYLFPLFILPLSRSVQYVKGALWKWATVFCVLAFQMIYLASWLYFTPYKEYWIPYRSVVGL